MGGVGRRRSLHYCHFLGHQAPNQTLRAQDRVTVDVATRTDTLTLPLKRDPPPVGTHSSLASHSWSALRTDGLSEIG